MTMESRGGLMEFYGRAKELEFLRSVWHEVTGHDGDAGSIGTPATVRRLSAPHMLTIIAESGMGKTRLLRELYRWLAAHPLWNPGEFRYWPESLGQAADLNAPIASDHIKGPPAFYWLGVKLDGSSYALPILREKLRSHVETVRSKESRFTQFVCELKDKGRKAPAELIWDGVANVANTVGVPGFVINGLRACYSAAKKLDEQALGPTERERQSHMSAGDELLALLELIMGSKAPVPVVLALDDAQNMDALTVEFVERLWSAATACPNGWPLLIVATHWEQEWRRTTTSGSEEAQRSFAGLFRRMEEDGRAGKVCEWMLSKSTADDLGDYLDSKLPGLSPAQRSLLLEKADGNFLSLVEDVGFLRMTPPCFVDRNPAGMLTEMGVQAIGQLVGERKQRVHSRFYALQDGHREMLGLASHSGPGFLRQVVENSARQLCLDGLEEVLPPDRIVTMLDECADPYAVLEFPGELFGQFRDRLWLEAAKDYARMAQHEHAPALRRMLQNHLADWVGRSFNEHGELRSREDELRGASVSILQLEVRDRRTLLDMAASEFVWEGPGDGTFTTEQALALRVQMLLNRSDAMDSEWDRIRQRVESCMMIDWRQVPETVISSISLNLAAVDWIAAGAFSAACSLLEVLLARLGVELEGAPARFEERGGGRKPVLPLLNRRDARRCFQVMLNLAKAKRHLDRTDDALAIYQCAESLCRKHKLGDQAMFQALMGRRRCLQLLRRQDEVDSLPFDDIDFSRLPAHYFAAIVASEDALREALAQAEQSGDRTALAIQAAFLAKLHRNRREYEAAVRYYELALDHAGGDHQRRTINAMVESVAQAGSRERLDDLLRRVFGHTEHAGMAQDLAVAYLNAGRARLISGDPDAALGLLKQAMAWEFKRNRSTHLGKIIQSLGMVGAVALMVEAVGAEILPGLQALVQGCKDAMAQVSDRIREQQGADTAKKARKQFNRSLGRVETARSGAVGWVWVFSLARAGRNHRELPDVLVAAARTVPGDGTGFAFGCWLGAAYLGYLGEHEVFARSCLASAQRVLAGPAVGLDLAVELEPGVSAGDFLQAFEIEVARKIHYRDNSGDGRTFSGWRDAMKYGWSPKGVDAAGWYAVWLLECGDADEAFEWSSKAVELRDQRLHALMPGQQVGDDIVPHWELRWWLDKVHLEAALRKATMPCRMRQRDAPGMGVAQEVLEGLVHVEVHFNLLEQRFHVRKAAQKDFQHPDWYPVLRLVHQLMLAQLRPDAEPGGFPAVLEQELREQVSGKLVELGFEQLG
ncbi:hypothetical protein [Denitratimonas sp. CY0512]|uniref:hypothetical protein n=1 Tax=Denitratimonas sp. CY0512 TaxID=3131940 RepID=UPI0030A6960B